MIPVCSPCLERIRVEWPGLGQRDVRPIATGKRRRRRWCRGCDLNRARWWVPGYVLRDRDELEVAWWQANQAP